MRRNLSCQILNGIRQVFLQLVFCLEQQASSKDAKKVYTECTAAVLRAKDCVMKTVTTVQENAGDIYADAQQINEDRKAAEEPFEDEAAEGETEFKETDEAEEAETEEAAE